MTFVVTTTTELKQEGGPFTVGGTVKVHFTTGADGVNLAREIETEFANDSGGSDDDGNGSFEGAEGHAYGVIDSLPEIRSGPGSSAASATPRPRTTRFEQSDGNFAAGGQRQGRVFPVNGSGGRIADKIETTNDDGGAEDPGHAKFFGFVQTMPASGLVGDWTGR